MGLTKSRKARAVITVSPSLRFTELPESQTVQIGVDVSFTCKVDGRPTPNIQWWR
uniref:Peroxidasin n=2 Tax=Apis cerana TaxID=7461 RepID=V9IKD1_APICE